MALALNGAVDVFAGAVDTDGIDGTEDAAGAVITPSTLSRASERGIDVAVTLIGTTATAFLKRSMT